MFPVTKWIDTVRKVRTRVPKLARSPEAPMDEMTSIAEEVQRIIRRAGPALRVETRWGHPWFVGRDLVVLVGAFSRHVGVEFWRGSSLPNPDGILEGTGKNLRHVKLRTLEEARSRAFATLVRQALELDARSEKRTR